MSGDVADDSVESRLRSLEARTAMTEHNLIRIVTTPTLNFVQKYAAILIFVGTLAGLMVGHFVK